MPLWAKSAPEGRQADVERLVAALDPDAARSVPLIKSRAKVLEAFAEFSFGLRQPHVHRLFITTARRTRLAKRPDLAIFLDRATSELKHQFDLPTVRRARQSAERVTTAMSAGILEFVGDVEIAEAVRVAELAVQAASVHMKDVHDSVWEAGSWFTAGEALRTAAHTLEIIELAYLGDGRASGGMGSAVASANAQVAVQQATREHIKWLERAAAA